jgi:hypothetical protein
MTTERAGNFGLFKGETFAQRFNAGVFEAIPGVLTSAQQFERAQAIERAHVPGKREWREGSARYLFVMINEHDNRGGFHYFPLHVMQFDFQQDYYPASFRWFVIDPTNRAEVEFLARTLCLFWEGVEMQRRSPTRLWFYRCLMAHDLPHWDVGYQLNDDN